MIVKCPECGHDISDKAAACPNCGNPLAKKKTKTTKRMRLPNGFGRITKITGKRLRKPYRAVVTVGKHPDGRLITKTLKPGYYSTYNEAYQALLDYHKSPYSFDNDLTVLELYEKWFEIWKKGKSDSTVRTQKSVWSYFTPLYNTKVKELKAVMIKECIMNGTRTDNNGDVVKITHNMKMKAKVLFDQMLDYAVEMEIIEKNCAKNIKPYTLVLDDEYDTKGHITFTEDEFKVIENNLDDEFVKIVYVHCYMGWRPNELITIKLEHVNLEMGYIQHGEKTKAGKNRIVPIHSKIKPIIDDFFTYSKNAGIDELITYEGRPLYYKKYNRTFEKMITKFNLNPEHKPHDCRVTFVTRAKLAEVNDTAIKLIVGHAIKDLTESVYTKRDVSWLHKELEKVP